MVDEIFMSRPPAAVKPERKEPEELFSSKRLAVGEEAPLMSSPLVEAEAWLRVKRLLTRRVLSIVDEART